MIECLCKAFDAADWCDCQCMHRCITQRPSEYLLPVKMFLHKTPLCYRAMQALSFDPALCSLCISRILPGPARCKRADSAVQPLHARPNDVKMVSTYVLQARALPSRTFPQVFLHHMMGICSGWEPPQRMLVHSSLITLLPVATDGLKDTQLHGLLSTIWHEVRLPLN